MQKKLHFSFNAGQEMRKSQEGETLNRKQYAFCWLQLWFSLIRKRKVKFLWSLCATLHS